MPIHDGNTITAATELAPHARTIAAAAIAAVIAAIVARRTA